ncbi:MAG: 3-hydroxyacyl-CoA dehydrogenase NAD-binding domain-containing protein, partial [Mesorhizobium sp.]
MADRELNRQSIAVVGGGLIGISWSALFSAYGHDVTLYEPAEAARDGIEARIASARAQISEIANDLPTPGSVTLADDLADAVRHASWIQENAPEKVALK